MINRIDTFKNAICKGEVLHQLLMSHFDIDQAYKLHWQFTLHQQDKVVYAQCLPPADSPAMLFPAIEDQVVKDYSLSLGGEKYFFPIADRINFYTAAKNDHIFLWEYHLHNGALKSLYWGSSTKKHNIHINFEKNAMEMFKYVGSLKQYIGCSLNFDEQLELYIYEKKHRTLFNVRAMTSSLLAAYEEMLEQLPKDVVDFLPSINKLIDFLRFVAAKNITKILYGKKIFGCSFILTAKGSAQISLDEGLLHCKARDGTFTFYNKKKTFFGGEKEIEQFTIESFEELASHLVNGLLIENGSNRFEMFKKIGEQNV
jgi:hypothetical protein